jgi:hypothetical protein
MVVAIDRSSGWNMDQYAYSTNDDSSSVQQYKQHILHSLKHSSMTVTDDITHGG